jgi:hypothetical protein
MSNPKISAEMLQEAWGQILLKMPLAEGRSFLQKSLTEGPVSLSAAVRVKDSMPGLLLQIPDASLIPKWIVLKLSGIKFDPVIKLDDGYGFPLMLADPKARDIFAVLASDIASAISGEEGASAKLATLFSRLALWRRFLQKRSGPMSEEEVRGLIGELTILEQLVPTKGVDLSLNAWRGPRDELHDFHLNCFRIEVKTWSNNSLPRVFISDPSQIVADETCPVWLAAVQISNNEESGRSLFDWVESLRVVMDNAQKDVYDALLADYGFLAEHAEFYPERYGIRDTVFYQITESFPRIDAASIPAGLCCVKYAIELSAIAGHAKPSPIN